jgi:hypothetical protein
LPLGSYTWWRTLKHVPWFRARLDNLAEKRSAHDPLS